MRRWLPLIALTLLLATVPAAAQSYTFPAEHEHTLGSCRGTLVITPEKIEYKTADEKHGRAWQYVELQQMKVDSKTKLELLTYEDEKPLASRDREWKFKLLQGEITPEISALLQAQATRPLITSVQPVADGAPRFEVLVKHLHNFGGCSGTLRIYPNLVAFESTGKPEHARFWRYPDIENFSQSERFRFEIATFEAAFIGLKSYNFQLKQELPPQAYDYVWARVHPSKFSRGEQVDTKTRTSQVWVEVTTPGESSAWECLWTSLSVIRCAPWARSLLLAYREAAVQAIGAKQVVYLLTNQSGVFAQREVTPGSDASGLAAIYAGLDAGDRVACLNSRGVIGPSFSGGYGRFFGNAPSFSVFPNRTP